MMTLKKMMKITTLQQIGIKILLNLMKIMKIEFKIKKIILTALIKLKNLRIL